VVNESGNDLSVRRKCGLLELHRSCYYYKSRNAFEISNLCNQIHELWQKYSFFGYRKITNILRGRDNSNINSKKVLRLMRLMGLQAIYPKPRTTVINKVEYKYPYLLKNLEINKPNQVWAVDITYIKTPNGFVYLCALIDLFSRFIVSWKMSISMDSEFCLNILNQGLRINNPEIINSDQGSQFTSNDWIEALNKNKIQISMDGKGRWVDNVYIERFWRTIKQEQIYLNPPDNISELKKQIDQFINFYNYQRPHQSLNYKTPSQIYFENENKRKFV